MSSPAPLAVQRRRFAVAAPGVVALCLLFAVLLSDAVHDATAPGGERCGPALAGVLGAVSCGSGPARPPGSAGAPGGCSWARPSWPWLATSGPRRAGRTRSRTRASWVRRASRWPCSCRSPACSASRASGGAASTCWSCRSTGSSRPVRCSSCRPCSSIRGCWTPPPARAPRATTLLFPLLDIVLVTVAVLLILRGRGPDRPVLALVAGGFVMYAIADLAFAVLAEQDRFQFGTPLDLGWIAGYLISGLAAWYPSDPRRTPRSTPPTAAPRTPGAPSWSSRSCCSPPWCRWPSVRAAGSRAPRPCSGWC